MKVIIAPNAFKGSLSAEEAAENIAQGMRKSKLVCSLVLMPIADGGDGTGSLLAKKMNGRSVEVKVHDPLGRKIDASFSFAEQTQTAIIEMSEASGIRLLKKEELNPLIADTRGTGELILAALDQGAKHLLLGVGGSATVDGGAGLLQALGMRFLNDEGMEITEFPRGLQNLKIIDASDLDVRLRSCEIKVLCDVKNTLLGETDAVKSFGPQKGASEIDIPVLEKCLAQLSEVASQTLGIDMASMKYGGAAGGVAAGVAAFLNGQLISGIDFFLDEIHFDKALENADLIITAEGSLDAQTLEGKGPYGVALRAKKKNVAVIALAGKISLSTFGANTDLFDAILSIGRGPSTIEEAVRNTATDLVRTAYQLGNILALKQR
jgi:glycerate kinase